MTDNELLLAISEMLDKKLDSELKPIKNDIHNMKLFQENIILPRLNTIESCYTDTYNHYKNRADKIEAVYADV